MASAPRPAALAALASAAALAAGCDGTGPGGPGFPAPEPSVLDTGHLGPLPATPDNPLTVEGVALGRRLFHDPVLSADRTMACASCHAPERSFTDGRPVSEGVTGEAGPRNAPVLVNVAWARELFWDGRAPSLEEQAREPVPDPLEMNLPWGEAVARLEADPAYPELFGRAFGTIEVTPARVGKALAQFQRTFVSFDSKWDRVQRGEDVFTAAEERGRALFHSEHGTCFHCHGSIFFTDERYHDNGLDAEPADPGRQAVTGRETDRGKFRTPSLRNVAVTAPYMHDGRFATLEEVLGHYAEGIARSPNLDPLLGVHPPPGLALGPGDRADLVAFLRTLTDPLFLENPDFRAPAP